MWEIITDIKLFDCESDAMAESLYNQQQAAILDRLGCGATSLEYVWLINNKRLFCGGISDMFDTYVTKDGADLVEFDNGHIGYVLYENCCVQVVAEMLIQSMGTLIEL